MKENTTTADRILDIERQIYELNSELNTLRKANAGVAVRNYSLTSLGGNTSLRELFGAKTSYWLFTIWDKAVNTAHFGQMASMVCSNTWNRSWRWSCYRWTHPIFNASSRIREAGVFAWLLTEEVSTSRNKVSRRDKITTREQCFTNYMVMKFCARIHASSGQETPTVRCGPFWDWQA